jgi:hypothetical protein
MATRRKKRGSSGRKRSGTKRTGTKRRKKPSTGKNAIVKKLENIITLVKRS